MSGITLEANGVALVLAARPVLSGVSFAADAGTWTSIVGPNGAGKSTLLAVLAGLRRPDAGQVLLQGRPLAAWPARQRAQRLAWLSQHGGAEGEISARDVVMLARLPRHGLLGAPDAGDHAATDAAMAETECADFAARRLSELSGGERQRVLLARLLAVGAGVMLLDEPTTHLDAPHQRALCASLAARAHGGAAVVSVLHDLTLALAADRVVVMQQGRIAGIGAPGDLALHATLTRVFGGALTVERVGARWVAVPLP